MAFIRFYLLKANLRGGVDGRHFYGQPRGRHSVLK